MADEPLLSSCHRYEHRTGQPISSLHWFELHPPPGATLSAVTAMVRPLASRPRIGWFKRTPVTIFELWWYSGTLHWLLGVEHYPGQHIATQLAAQMPKLHSTPLQKPVRPTLFLGSNVHPTGLTHLLRLDMAEAVSAGLLEVLTALEATESAVVQWVIGPSQDRTIPLQPQSWPQRLGLVSSTRPLTANSNPWQQKINEPLFAVRGGIGACTALPAKTVAVVRMLADALALASASHAEVRATKPTGRCARRLWRLRTNRGRWAGIVNAAELAVLLGWPLGDAAHSLPTYGMFPAPSAALLAKQPSARVIGVSLHPKDGSRQACMPIATALHHVQVIGPTGSGKSDLLAGFGRADVMAGRSLLVMEPKGDLIAQVLAGIPTDRHEDVVVIEPGHQAHVVGVNPLAGPLADAERRADELLEVFDTLYGNGIGPRSRDVLLHSLIALARSDGGTLVDLPALLTNPNFRRRILTDTTDPLVLAPFFGWFESLADAQQSMVVAPLLNKVRAFLSRSAVRRFLGQAQPAFAFDDLFAKPRVVLVNLNRGLVGDAAATLLGTSILLQAWRAAQRRAHLSPSDRNPVMVIIDEVQDYLRHTAVVRSMLEQARGLGLSLTLAHQTLSQLSPPVRSAVIANARSRIVFRPGADDAKPLAAALGGDVDAASLNRLGAFEACGRLLLGHTPSQPFVVRTQRLAPGTADVAALRLQSQQRYGVDGDVLDAALTERWYSGNPAADEPIGALSRRQP